jgi:serine protease AprX
MTHFISQLKESKSQAANWGRRSLHLLLTLALVLGLLAPASEPATSTPLAHLQPLVAQLAAEAPAQIISVIVQKAASNQAEVLTAHLGGKVTKDLSIIKAFAAEMTAGAALELAASPAVRWVSLDARVQEAGGGGGGGGGGGTTPKNYYLDTLGVRSTWNMGLKGQGLTVAVIDSGISLDSDFSNLSRLQSFNSNSNTINDVYGHGTHVSGILGGNGAGSSGAFQGVAPQINLISLKISDETGMAYESDTVEAMQWVLDNKAAFNIRVVNLSLNSTVEQSYHTSPLDAAAEILWFNGIVVVVSAGNKGPGGGYNTANAAPANDPFVITVGASDEKATTKLNDDTVAAYSAYGVTVDGFAKPDLIAPGTNIYSVLSRNSPWGTQYPERLAYNGEYFRLSGTSMAAPMVAGAAALLLQDEPNLTPDQVKYRLLNAGNTIAGSTSDPRRSYPYLNVYKAVTGTTTQSANTGLQASQLLWTGSDPVNWDSMNWESVNWESVNWESVNWESVNWESVNWESVYWGP